MSKELSPLEECEYLITNAIIHNPHDRKRLWVIHKALKEKEETDNQLNKLFDELGIETRKDLVKILNKYNEARVHELKVRDFDKKLKALEILKEILDIKIHIDEEENVAILYVDVLKDFETKETTHLILGYVQEKEEYDLLKEVLLCLK